MNIKVRRAIEVETTGMAIIMVTTIRKKETSRQKERAENKASSLYDYAHLSA